MREVALRYGLAGWVRNRDDGAVEALVEGEETQVEKLLEWARVGPPGANVTSFVKRKLDGIQPHRGFHVFLTDPGRRRAANR